MKYKFAYILLAFTLVFSSCKSKKTVTKTTKKERTQREVDIQPEFKVVIPSTTTDYISMYKQIAMDEMRGHKIPASITLAQGILESSSGKSPLALRSNNHFGIKCHKEWNGKTTRHNDDKRNECFRVYDDPRDSYRDHSQFLLTRSRYADLFKLKEDDYTAWAKGLKKAGYATDKRYPAKLIDLIEKYGLYRYDVEVLGKNKKKRRTTQSTSNQSSPTQPRSTTNNSAKNHKVSKGDTLYSLSRKYGVSVSELKAINKLNSNIISIGQVLKIR